MSTAFRPTSAAVDAVLARFSHPKSTANGWQVQCPAHDDQRASLSISMGDEGKCILTCHAGCDTAAIVAKLGLKMSDLFVSAPRPAGRSTIVATYDYTDAAGNLLYQAVRLEPKSFRQRRRNSQGEWEWSLGDVERVLYRLPEVQAAVAAGGTVYIAEGEKDVNALRLLGLTATCNAMGAGKWLTTYSETLRGADVVILPDNDHPGRAHAQQVAASLASVANSIKIVDLPGLPDKGDVSDWLAYGHTADELQQLTEKAPQHQPSPSLTEPSPERRWLTEEEHDQLPPGTFLIDQEIPADGITVLYGPSGSGKTFVALDYGMRIAQSKPVLFVPAEDSAGLALRRRAWRGFHQTTAGTVYTWPEEVNLLNPIGEVDILIDQTRDLGLGLVIFDTLHQSMVGGDENSSRDMGVVIQSCKRIQRETGAAVMLVHHTGKNGASERGSSSLRGAASAMIELSNEDGLIRLRCEKAKNSTPFADRYLRLFETGDSCVALPAESVVTTKAAPLSKTQREILAVLNLAVFENIGAKSSEIGKATGIPDGTLWRTLSTLKRLHYVEQSSKGDPYYLTDEGRAKLEAETTLASNTAHSKAQLSQLSPTLTELSESSHPSLTISHTPIGVRDERRSEREGEDPTDPPINRAALKNKPPQAQRIVVEGHLRLAAAGKLEALHKARDYMAANGGYDWSEQLDKAEELSGQTARGSS
jgi:hypothetical protein